MKIIDRIKGAAVLMNAHEVAEIFGLLGLFSGRIPKTDIADEADVKNVTEASLSFDNFKIVLHRPLPPEEALPRLVYFVDGVEVDAQAFANKLADHSKEIVAESIGDNPTAKAALEESFAELKENLAKRGGGFPTGGESDFLPN
jgi:hypothetical protein